MTAEAINTFAKAHGNFLVRCREFGLSVGQASVLCALPCLPDKLAGKAGLEESTLKTMLTKLRSKGLVKPATWGVKAKLYERTLAGDTLIAGRLLPVKPSTQEASQ